MTAVKFSWISFLVTVFACVEQRPALPPSLLGMRRDGCLDGV